MLYTLQNERITVTVESLGGQLMSLQDADGTEYLWQGDPAYWAGRAPNLFPIVGRLVEARYTYGGNSYDLPIHGFLRHSELECTHHTPETLTLVLRDNQQTRQAYPFAFVFTLRYTLQDTTLQVEYAVENTDDKALYFGVGGHPGFCVPLEAGLTFADYYLEFSEEHTPNLQQLTDTCFVTGNKKPYPLQEGRRLPLHHGLFDNDALVFSEVCRSVTLKSDKGIKSVRVDYPQMPYLGIWHKPKTDAPYVCIEPWSSLPGDDGVITALEQKADLTCLLPGESYRNCWSITLP